MKYVDLEKNSDFVKLEDLENGPVSVNPLVFEKYSDLLKSKDLENSLDKMNESEYKKAIDWLKSTVGLGVITQKQTNSGP